MIYLESRDNFDIIFIRYNRFDNSNTIRKLPYDGIHCWCIYKKDYDKYITELEFWNGDSKYVTTVNPLGKNIYALDYKESHDYVTGESDTIPVLETFNKNKHTMNFIKQDKKSLLEYTSDMKYQIIIL